MKKNNYNVIGVMSRTSLDGVDLAPIKFHLNNNFWTFKIIKSEIIGYNQCKINQQKAVAYPEIKLQNLPQNIQNFL